MNQSSVNVFKIIRLFSDADNFANPHVAPIKQSYGSSVTNISVLIAHFDPG
jgi:hypothetical protein